VKRPRRRPDGAAAAPRARGAAAGSRTALAVAARAGLAALAFLMPRMRPAPASRAAALPDSAAALDAATAHAEAVARMNRHQALLSLPFFERARAAAPESTALAIEHAAALQDAALEPGARSSVERVRLLIVASDALERSAAGTPDPITRSRLHFQRAYLLRVSGFPLDAMLELNLAATEDPASADIAAAQIGLVDRLRRPDDPRR
jgi:hypothetical protein